MTQMSAIFLHLESNNDKTFYWYQKHCLTFPQGQVIYNRENLMYYLFNTFIFSIYQSIDEFSTAFDAEISAKFVPRNSGQFITESLQDLIRQWYARIAAARSEKRGYERDRQPHAFGKLVLFKRERPPPWCRLNCSRLHVLGWLGVMTPKPYSWASEGLDTGQIPPRKMLWELMSSPSTLHPPRHPSPHATPFVTPRYLSISSDTNIGAMSFRYSQFRRYGDHNFCG